RFRPRFDASGLMPCIAVDAATGEALMLAWVNEAALAETLATGTAHYWSRSRGALWKKGEASGAVQRIVEVRTDCDQDAILYKVEVAQRDATCHTGRPTCFYRRVRPGPGGLDRPLDFDPEEPA
ncbi:MAG TPA: phosphoribosyl-AMP cyclohydrolase, partial [Afifellaceae bacterium]|nr:phosphoribosyl-AMP cyclohydrolase [Afifellaceae bacterium]